MRNPYLTIEGCVDRLYKEYQKHPRLIVAVDHDDTVFDYHNNGYDYSDTTDVLKRCQELNFYIVVFTGTPKEKWDDIFAFWDKQLGIPITCINRNPIKLPFGNDGKIYYNILLDDRGGLGQSIEILNRLINKIQLKKFWNEAERI
jgi:hypothetical protein